MMTENTAVFASLMQAWSFTLNEEAVPNTTTDFALVRLAAGGSSAAITMLVERYSPYLHRYLVRLTGNASLAEDILQDTWLRVMEKLDRYDAQQPFSPWLFRVAHNCAVDNLRRQPRNEWQFGPDRRDDDGYTGDAKSIPVQGASALEELSAKELEAYLATAFDGLPRHYREILALRFQQEMSIKDAAKVLGLALSTAKTRIQRGLALLRRRLEVRIEP